MAFREVSASANVEFVKLSQAAAGDVLAVGTYEGTRENEFGVSYAIRQQDDTTKMLGSWGQLNYLIKNAGLKGGELVRVTYKGQEAIAKGPHKGRPAHTFGLEIDNDA